MFCDRCGANLPQTARFCPNCGKSFAPVPQAQPAPRVAGHIKTLGVLWIVYSAIHMIPGFIVGSMPHWLPFFNSDMPFFMGGLFRMIGGVLLVKGIIGVIAGWGLLERQSWARILAIVIACVSLIHFPLGTAIGIYTLWVLLPGTSEMEYRQMARS